MRAKIVFSSSLWSHWHTMYNKSFGKVVYISALGGNQVVPLGSAPERKSAVMGVGGGVAGTTEIALVMRATTPIPTPMPSPHSRTENKNSILSDE